jgi:hypothetical protein
VKMKIPNCLKLGVIAAGFWFASAAYAFPVTWVVDINGGAISGTFVFDADTNTLSAVDILSVSGPFLGPAFDLHYSDVDVVSAGPIGMELTKATTDGVIQTLLVFDGPLTNAGGTLGFGPLAHQVELFPGGGAGGRTFSLTSSVSAIPIPAAVWLFGSGLGLLGFVRKRAHSR